MQQVQHSSSQPSRGGGRVSSIAYRRSLALCDDFTGLDADCNRYELLLTVKRAAKPGGFTPRMIQLIDYLTAFTRDVDWEEGSRPIVYQSLARTAMDLGITERQVQKLEKQLFEAGAITWNDSGNHRRYGQRDSQTGRLLYAFGVDLTPLAYLRAELEEKLHQKRLHDHAWFETKRQISWCRRQIRSLLLECQTPNEPVADWLQFERRYDSIAIAIRTYMGLDELRQLLVRHEELHSALLAHAAHKHSVASNGDLSIPDALSIASSKTPERELYDVNYNYSTQELTSDCSPPAKGFQESVAAPTDQAGIIPASGLQHISLAHVLRAASDRFRECLPLERRPMNWQDVVEAAWRLRPALHISQASWGEAVALLGRTGAAVALLITDQATLRESDPVAKPAAYFRGMLNRARQGQLRLHNSIFGLIGRGDAAGQS